MDMYDENDRGIGKIDKVFSGVLPDEDEPVSRSYSWLFGVLVAAAVILIVVFVH